MSTQDNLSRDKDISQDLNSAKAQNKQTNLLALTADYYTEWTIENKSFEKSKSKKTGNSVEVPAHKVHPHRLMNSKHKRGYWNGDSNVSALYNEIYNRPELNNFPRRLNPADAKSKNLFP